MPRWDAGGGREKIMPMANARGRWLPNTSAADSILSVTMMRSSEIISIEASAPARSAPIYPIPRTNRFGNCESAGPRQKLQFVTTNFPPEMMDELIGRRFRENRNEGNIVWLAEVVRGRSCRLHRYRADQFNRKSTK